MANDKLFCIYVKDDGTPGDGGAHGRKIYLTGSEGVKEIGVKIPACAPGQSILTVGEYIAHIQGAMQAGKYPKACKPYAAGYLWARSMGAPADLLGKILAGIVAVVQKNNDPSEKGALQKLHARLASEAPAPKPVAPIVIKGAAEALSALKATEPVLKAAMEAFNAPAPVAPAPVAETKVDRFQLIEIDADPVDTAPVAPVKACGLPCIYSPGKGCPTCEDRWARDSAAHAADRAAAAAAPKPVVALPGARLIELDGIDVLPAPETADGSCGFDENRMGYAGETAPHVPLADRFALIELD